MKLVSTQGEINERVKLMAKRSITPGPRDERGVLSARIRSAARDEFAQYAWTDDEIGPVLRAVLLTAAHDETTREKLRRVVESSLMGVSQLGVDERDRKVRSGLISSQIMGLALMRFVWKIEPVASMTDDEVVAAIAPNLQRYIEGEIG